MAPLTRYRANEGHAHTELGVQYYAQRAEVPGTLLVTEGTLISPEAGGYDRVPGIWSDEQIAAWKKVGSCSLRRALLFLTISDSGHD
jgi:NADPH2 dehydrogenase